MHYPNSLRRLIDSFKLLPGIGEKTAERLALSVLDMELDKAENFSKSISDVKNKIKKCEICHNLTEENICTICSSDVRDDSLICVVESAKDIILLENVGTYNGLYHVLDGLISPLDGVNPENLNIDSLIKRVQKNKIKEIILAITPSIEGETTALYISKLFENSDIIISKIAHGIPMGTNMEYMDSLTLEMALADRKKMSD